MFIRRKKKASEFQVTLIIILKILTDHVHQSEEEENLMARRLSGKFSGIEKMKKLLKPKKSTEGDEKAYIFNLF